MINLNLASSLYQVGKFVPHWLFSRLKIPAFAHTERQVDEFNQMRNSWSNYLEIGRFDKNNLLFVFVKVSPVETLSKPLSG